MGRLVYRRDSLDSFLDFASKVLPHSYAQHFQDLWFLWESGFKQEAYFVEFGALSGVDFSNTYVLEKLGWAGVVAEPHPDYEHRLRGNRSCTISTKCVYSRSGETIPFHIVEGRPALSAIGALKAQDNKAHHRTKFREILVPTVTLADLLEESDAPATVDCLSIDTEGSELEILSAYDFQSRPINCICVEHNGSALREGLFKLLTKNGYRRKFEAASGHDDWFVLDGTYQDWNATGCKNIERALRRFAPFERFLEERIGKLHSIVQSL